LYWLLQRVLRENRALLDRMVESLMEKEVLEEAALDHFLTDKEVYDTTIEELKAFLEDGRWEGTGGGASN
jgi:hypothetical protein